MASGLCHSDLGMSLMPGEFGRQLDWRVPFTLGHEIAGWVAGIGDGVVHADGKPIYEVSGLKVGLFQDAAPAAAAG